MGAKDKAANTGEKIKGKAKEAAGKVSGNERMEAEGKAEQAKGDLKHVGEKAKDATKDVL
ncbi:CsbD family protein [Streptomyces sp. NPDC056105]|uniref:CsbD family protein n=1 Tax=Streptomyces sp. NPDC056105 TaxID=3345714 RepID=UPI0035DC77EF